MSVDSSHSVVGESWQRAAADARDRLTRPLSVALDVTGDVTDMADHVTGDVTQTEGVTEPVTQAEVASDCRRLSASQGALPEGGAATDDTVPYSESETDDSAAASKPR